MKDGFSREIDYLRISLTDKCNLRCGYCMPKEGITHLRHEDILTLEETGRIAAIMSKLGVRRVRLTGGEPLVRKGVAGFIRMLINECGISKVSMTSNGCLLDEHAKSLREAGLSEINISLDTLNRDTFYYLTGRDELDRVLKGIDTALKTGFHVKLNTVLLKGINDEEAEALVKYADGLGVVIRFIELMPLGCGRLYEGVSSASLIKRLETVYGKAYKTDRTDDDNKGPAEYYDFEKLGIGTGFISPMSHMFCKSCSRVRLTAEGFLKLCLQYPDGVDLRDPLRSGMSDGEIKEIIEKAVLKKPECHSFSVNENNTDRRKMAEIGG